ncbi:MAG: acetyl-CoA carboxylase biotin carboxyl carrier protein subunit [Fimbriimonas sp.]
MAENKARISELAELMREFRLNEAHLSVDEFSIAFSRNAAPVARTESAGPAESVEVQHFAPVEPPKPEVPKGTPITSPMTGIYYSSSSPSAPAFVKEGEPVTTGQIVGLIEAMKVFNEIPSPISGTLLKQVAQSGQLVQPGDVLLLIG